MRYRYEGSRFDFSEADAIAEHLAAMAEKGWQLDQAGPHLWRYRKAAPQKLRYAVGYLPGIHSAAPLPAEEVGTFRALYEAAGWNFVTEWYFVQIFATADPDAVAPDTDESIKLEALRRSVGKQLWSNWLLVALFALMLSILIGTSRQNPLFYLSSNTTLVVPWFLLVVILVEIAPVFRFLFWKRRAQKALAEGGVCPPLRRCFRRLKNAALWLVLAVFAAAVILDAMTNTGAGWMALRLLLWMLCVMALSSFSGWIRRRSSNRGVFWSAFVLGFIVLCVIYLAIPDGEEAKQTSQEALPLSVRDLGYEPEDNSYCWLDVSQSVLLRHTEASELESGNRLSYDIYYTTVDRVYDLCLAEVKQYTDWEPLADGIWTHPYQVDEYHGASYLVVTSDAILVLDPPDPLNEEQLETAIAHLLP